MPKNKSWGENTKAVEAKARKAGAVAAAKERKEKEKDDAAWEDDDKQLARKQNRKAEEEKKRLEKLQRKNESKALEEQEKDSIVTTKGPAVQKITQAQIAAENERREAAARKSAVKANAPPKPIPLVENLNRLQPVEEATTIDQALKMLRVMEDDDDDDEEDVGTSDGDRHPERRMKAAYKAFASARLPILKAENPSLRLSQLKQMIFDEFQKSPENPLNKQ